jgi:hypothetical protein
MEYDKDPDAHLDYFWDWTKWLAPAETIINHTIEVDPVLGVDVDTSSVDAGGKKVVAWLDGGEPNTSVAVTCHILTSEGREDDRTMDIWVKER